MTFIVFGSPATKGSTVSFMGNHGIVTKTDSQGLASWTQAVGWAARVANVPYAGKSMGLGVKVTATFQFVKPKKYPARWQRVIVRPDIDKLTRALLDALTGVVYDDDSQVVSLVVDKVYGPDTRTTVTVERLL